MSVKHTKKGEDAIGLACSLSGVTWSFSTPLRAASLRSSLSLFWPRATGGRLQQ
jgi:hypothetical protein